MTNAPWFPATAVAEALRRLADGCTTPADVAARLKQAECEGEPKDCLTCPVAQWVSSIVADLCPDSEALVWVLPGFVRVGPIGSQSTVRMPVVVSEFVLEMDHQLHPELVAEAV